MPIHPERSRRVSDPDAPPGRISPTWRLLPVLAMLGIACSPLPTARLQAASTLVTAPPEQLEAIARAARSGGAREVQVLETVGAITWTGGNLAAGALPAEARTWTPRPRNMIHGPGASGGLDLSAPTTPLPGPEGEPLGGYQWGLETARVQQAWERAPQKGAGVRVAILDTGLDPDNPDLTGQLDRSGARSFVGSADDWVDRNGHGTHVAGIVAARLDGGGVTGVAPGSQIVPIKVLGDDGWGDDASVLAGLEWAADQGVQVVNLSLSGLYDPDGDTFALRAAYARAIGRLHDRGIVVVMASGNEGLTTSPGGPVVLPAQAGEGLVVGAVGPRGGKNGRQFAPYTNHGPGLLDLAAPGGGARLTRSGGLQVEAPDLVLSTWSTHARTRDENGIHFEAASHRYMGGTSMACAHVSGVAALLRSAIPTMDARSIERALSSGVFPRGPRDRYGSGILDARRALEQALDRTPRSMPPEPRP